MVQSAALAYVKNGQYKWVDIAESVAVDPRWSLAYVVSGSQEVLLFYDLRAQGSGPLEPGRRLVHGSRL